MYDGDQLFELLGADEYTYVDDRAADRGTGVTNLAFIKAALRAATSPSSRRSGQLQVISTDSDNLDQPPDAALTVVVAVVDGRTPQLADLMRTDAMVLGVSAGAATAEQLARIAASAAADDRRVAGILVADPDPADPTTGRLPQLARPTQTNMPTRLAGTPR